MLVICANCGREMRCVKTGLTVKIDDYYAYSGDKFECKFCNNKTVLTGNSGMDYPNGVKVDEHTIILNQE